MALDGVTSFGALKILQMHLNVCETLQLWRNLFSSMAESSKKLKSSKVFALFIVCSNRNRSALVRELLRNNSQFVGQLYKDKRLVI